MYKLEVEWSVDGCTTKSEGTAHEVEVRYDSTSGYATVVMGKRIEGGVTTSHWLIDHPCQMATLKDKYENVIGQFSGVRV